MAKFATELNSVSHGDDEFVATDGVIEIPGEKVPAFAALIASGELVLVEEAPAEKSLDESDEPKKKSKKG